MTEMDLYNAGELYRRAHCAWRKAISTKRAEMQEQARKDFEKYVMASANSGNELVCYVTATREMREYIVDYAVRMGFSVTTTAGNEVQVSWKTPPPETSS